MPDLIRPFDADNHYYEAEDAFTRHMDKKMVRRAVQWIELNGRKRVLVGDKLHHFIPNPAFERVAQPGAMDEFFRGRNVGDKDARELWGELEPIRPEYRDRDARLAVLDAQNLDGCILFPTLGVGIEEYLTDDPEALVASFRAFNRWLEEDWGYNYRDRLFTAPLITLVDPAAAVSEIERVIDLGARIVCLRSAPVRTADGPRSPSHEIFDPFWARVAEAGITAAFHAGDSGYQRYDDWEYGTGANMLSSPFRSMVFHDRPAFDTFSALVCHGVLERFPRLRVASIEQGSDWVAPLLKKLEQVKGRFPSWWSNDPIETFQQQVWIAPFYEDDMLGLRDLIGIKHVLFGSDWPHAEGLADPTSFAKDFEAGGYTKDEIDTIMCQNTRDILAPAVS